MAPCQKGQLTTLWQLSLAQARYTRREVIAAQAFFLGHLARAARAIFSFGCQSRVN